jgi:hypothetical protein
LNNSNYKLTLNFTESYTIIPLNIWTTDGFGSYRLGLYEYNFLGRNTVLGGYYQYNEFHSYGINFSSPSLFSANVGAEANFQKWNSKEPVFYKQQQIINIRILLLRF